MTATQLTYDEGQAASGPQVLAPGTILSNGQYRIDRHLGSGGFGITYLARDSLERTVVIKECYPEAICTRNSKTVQVRSTNQVEEFKTMVTMFVREARSIAKLNHPNIVGVHQVFEDNHTAYMALDYVDGPDLLSLLEVSRDPVDPGKIKSLLLKALDAVQTVHNQDMLHRDLSPDNILINRQGEPVLIDFGAAREEASKKSRALSAIQVVKDGYSPQEFYIAGGLQSPSSDLYSLAATFAHLITRDAPPNSQTRLAEIAAHNPDPYVPLAGRFDGYEPEFLQAIDTAMSVFPRDRLQSAEDWLLQIDPDKRRQLALAAAEEDSEIAETVSNLISLTDISAEKTLPPVPLDTLFEQDAQQAAQEAPPAPARTDQKPAAHPEAVSPAAKIPFPIEDDDDFPSVVPMGIPDLDDPLDLEVDLQEAPEIQPVRPRRISAPNGTVPAKKRQKTVVLETADDGEVANALRKRKSKTARNKLSATGWVVRIVMVSLIGLALYEANRIGFNALPAVVIDAFLGLVFADATGTGTLPTVLKS